MQNLNIVFANKYIWLSLIIFIPVLIFAFRLYSKKTFPNTNSLRNMLLFTRLSALFLIFFVLLRPGCSFNKINKIRPKNLIFVDNSKSIKFNNAFDKEKIINTIKKIEDISKKQNFDYIIFAYGDSIKKINNLNELSFDDNNTNFLNVLSYVDDNYIIENLNNIFVLTDGNFDNSQIISDFIKKIKTKIYFIPIGDTIKSPDLKINYVQYDNDAYLNKKHQFIVKISISNIKSKKIKLQIFNSQNKLIKEQTIKNLKNNITLEDSITLIPNKLGKAYYTFVLTSDEKEKNISNNKFVAAINVHKSKLKILMLWSYPDLDFKFLKKTFSGNKNIDLTSLILSNPLDKNIFKKIKNNILDFDVILLGRISILDLEIDEWDNLEKYIFDLKKPLVIFSGFKNKSLLNLKRTKIGKIVDYLNPGDILSLDFRKPVSFIPEYSQENNFFNIYSLENKNIEYWNNMPQITESVIIKKLPDFIKILGKIRYNNIDYPAVFINQNQGINVLFFCISGIWRWKFSILSLGIENLEFDDIFNNMIKFLIYYGNKELIQIKPIKEIVNSNEGVIFSGNINNIIDKKIYNEYLNLKIIDSTNTTIVDIKLKKDKNNQYHYMNNKLHAGKYKYIIDYYIDNQLQKSKNGIFYVIEEKKEFENSYVNLNYLEYISDDKNIFMTNDSQIETLTLSGKTKNIITEKRLYFWDNLVIYLLIVLFLATEWFIREKNLLL